MNNTINSIQVLGSGCPTCKKLFEYTKAAVAELGLGIEVEYVTDIPRIIGLGIMSFPALAIDNQVVLAGQLPTVEKIKGIITSEINLRNDGEEAFAIAA